MSDNPADIALPCAEILLEAHERYASLYEVPTELPIRLRGGRGDGQLVALSGDLDELPPQLIRVRWKGGPGRRDVYLSYQRYCIDEASHEWVYEPVSG